MADEENDREVPSTPPGEEPSEVPAGESGATFSRRPVIKKRRSRKERHEEIAQPDEFVEVGGTIVDWLIERGKIVGVILGVIVVGLLSAAILRTLDTSEQAEASAALFAARAALPTSAATSVGGGLSLNLAETGPDEDKRAKTEESVQLLEGVSKDFQGTPQSRQAQVIAGQALYSIGEYERALVFLVEAAAVPGLVGDRARNARGFTLLALERPAEAVDVFSELRDDTNGTAREAATINLAAAEEGAGDMDKARGVYELFETEFPDSDQLSEVQARAANAQP